jgi:hypothetical protein
LLSVKATILSPCEAALLPDVPLESQLVLDLGRDGYDPGRVSDAERHGHRVARLMASVPTLDDAVLDALAAQPVPCVARVDSMPTVRTALGRSRAIARQHLAVELPVESDPDLSTLKVLSSLGVLTAVDLRRVFGGGEVMLELITDAILRPGRRTPVAPIDDVGTHLDADDFELARVDLRGNDHHVDLRAGSSPAPDAWSPVDVWRKRERFLAEESPCTFCEGLLFCHGYLRAECGDACRAVFSEIFELHDVRKRRDAAKLSSAPGGHAKGACGC